ncbi:MAG: IclR family transcriptional regulator [Paracoccus sp. (in: a-proteobacteria)]|nr:IclR family transcriptional regulator [Paracoccus sp. (in: a-proteobacteria)]
MPAPPPETRTPDRYRAPALDKGLDILEILATQPGAMTRGDIVRAMGRSPSEIYRMLERLVARGYVARIEGGDRYILTMKLFLLAHRHPPLRRAVAQAQPLMDGFAQDTRQSCHLVMPENGMGIVIAQASPDENWEFRIRVGARLDLFETGSGLTLLAFQHPDRRAETLKSWGITAPEARFDAIAPHLARIRAEGCRQAPSRQLVGVTDLSAPVLGPDGDGIGVLTCAYIERPGDAGHSDRERALTRLRAVTEALSHR